MDALILAEIGALPEGVLSALGEDLSRTIAVPVERAPDRIDPSAAYVAARGQYDTRVLIADLEALSVSESTAVLGVADVDLFSAIFTFVFGEAQLNGRVALISLHRLNPLVYGLAADPILLRDRARREAIHEIGHLLGLVHCSFPGCVMRFSSVAEEVDLKRDRFCPDCARKVREEGGPPLLTIE